MNNDSKSTGFLSKLVSYLRGNEIHAPGPAERDTSVKPAAQLSTPQPAPALQSDPEMTKSRDADAAAASIASMPSGSRAAARLGEAVFKLLDNGGNIMTIDDERGIVDFDAADVDFWQAESPLGIATKVKLIPSESDFLTYIDSRSQHVYHIDQIPSSFGPRLHATYDAISPGIFATKSSAENDAYSKTVDDIVLRRLEGARSILDSLIAGVVEDGQTRKAFSRDIDFLKRVERDVISLLAYTFHACEIGLGGWDIPQSYFLLGGESLIVISSYSGAFDKMNRALAGGSYKSYLWYLQHSNPYVVQSKRSGKPFRSLINIIFSFNGQTANSAIAIQPIPPCGTQFAGLVPPEFWDFNDSK